MIKFEWSHGRQPHPASVAEAATFFDKWFPGWADHIELTRRDPQTKKNRPYFDIFIGNCCVFGQVFGDARFDFYRVLFLEEDHGLPPNKQPKNPGIFWKSKYNDLWVAEIKKRQKKAQSGQNQ